MTQNQAAREMRNLVGTRRFNLETSNYYNPRRTTYNVYTNYEQHVCTVGFGDNWQEAIEDLKKELGEEK